MRADATESLGLLSVILWATAESKSLYRRCGLLNLPIFCSYEVILFGGAIKCAAPS